VGRNNEYQLKLQR